MGHDELCNVSRYADKHYCQESPLPTAFPGTAEALEVHQRRTQLDTMKAALQQLPPQRQPRRVLHGTNSHTRGQHEQQQQQLMGFEGSNKPFPSGPAVNNNDGVDVTSPATATTGPYAKVELPTGTVAANQALVHEFLLDGSAQLNGETISGYPIYGHRSAEERLEALRAALYGDPANANANANADSGEEPKRRHTTAPTWKAVYYPPSRTVLAADEHTHLPEGAVENEIIVPETREQYWRRLARYFIHQHATTTTTTTTGDADAQEDGEEQHECEDPFYMVDLGRVVEQMALWRHCLPMVRPHFAVKCNPNPAIMEVLAACGAGFDCASKAEIDLVLQGGKRGSGSLVDTPDDIIFAHPTKQPGDLKAAARAGVNYVTFDSVLELEKIAKHMPNAKAILRIKTNDAKAACAFSVKFGAPLESVDALLDTARALNVEIYGVSFHVGSGNGDATAYTSAVEDAYKVFQMASHKGFNCTVLDIGGGYPGVAPTEDERLAGKLGFEDIAAALRPVLERLFPSEDTTIIAEPGRFFTAATHALCMNVYASRKLHLSAQERELCREDMEEHMRNARKVGANANADEPPLGMKLEDELEHQYYVNDGLYGSFNCIVFDHAAPALLLLDDGDGADNAKSDKKAAAKVENVYTATAAAAAATTTATTVISQAYSPQSPTSDSADVKDAVQNEVLMRRATLPARPLRVTTIFGPTCDSLDCIVKKKPFPEMRIGDWLLAPDMGSYTTAASCAFNGFLTRRREWVCSVDV